MNTENLHQAKCCFACEYYKQVQMNHCGKTNREVQPHFLCDDYVSHQLKFDTGKIIIDEHRVTSIP